MCCRASALIQASGPVPSCIAGCRREVKREQNTILCPSPGALASGPAVISCRRRYHCPSSGALVTGLGTAVGPGSRRLRRRRYADPPAAASFREPPLRSDHGFAEVNFRPKLPVILKFLVHYC
jgi:hypothetical protein